MDELKGIVDEQLLFDARRRLEAQLLAGNGTSPNLRGLDNTTGVLTRQKARTVCPWPWRRVPPRSSPPGIRRPRWRSTRTTGLTLRSVILTNGGSSLGDLLEVPVVKTASVAAGTGYVADWRQIVVWTRSTDVFVSRTHSDFLTRNLAAVLAEIRCAVGVLASRSGVQSDGHLLMASLESLEQTLGRFRRQEFKLVEHTPPSEKVSPVDIVRKDELGRKVVVCPLVRCRTRRSHSPKANGSRWVTLRLPSPRAT